MKLDNSIIETLLVTYDELNRGEKTLLDKIYNGKHDTSQTEKQRADLLDQIKTESDKIESGESVSNEELLDLVENLLLHERMAEKERQDIEDD